MLSPSLSFRRWLMSTCPFCSIDLHPGARARVQNAWMEKKLAFRVAFNSERIVISLRRAVLDKSKCACREFNRRHIRLHEPPTKLRANAESFAILLRDGRAIGIAAIVPQTIWFSRFLSLRSLRQVRWDSRWTERRGGTSSFIRDVSLRI